MLIEVPWPSKYLWPNGPRTRNPGHRASEVKKQRGWAYNATLEAKKGDPVFVQPVPVTLHVHAKPKGPLPDKDNCVAAAKSSLDGIADALGINDRNFDTPKVVFAPERTGIFIVEIGQ